MGFIALDKRALDEWFNKHRKEFKDRIDRLKINARTAPFIINCQRKSVIENDQYLARFVLIHTLSHILIKELEFLVGYPASSLCERLYINVEDMQGILIYAIAGSEGSYGGLIAQGSADRFKKVLKSALRRASDCTSDPVCYYSDGQGFGGLNLAACYSCALLPETSCEEFNSLLDRALLIDKEFGFFKDHL